MFFLYLTAILIFAGGCKSQPPKQEQIFKPSSPTEESIIGRAEGTEDDSALLPEELFDVKERLQSAFRLKPGDELEIRVFGRNDLTLSTVVPPDGVLTFPLVGRVSVAGVSPQDVERKIEESLKEKELVNPQVSVLVKSYSPRKAYILGEVRNAGGYSIPAGEYLTLTQILSLAGGFLPDADKKNIRLFRFTANEKKVYSISFTKLQKYVESGQDIPLLPGDVLVVGKMQRVYVLGCVNKPGGYSLDEGIGTLTKVIAEAGGLTRVAARSSIKILRSEKEGLKIIRINIDAVFEGKIPDLQVKEGDVIYIPESLF
jgi:polysaccharide export outer membrane protein